MGIQDLLDSINDDLNDLAITAKNLSNKLTELSTALAEKAKLVLICGKCGELGYEENMYDSPLAEMPEAVVCERCYYQLSTNAAKHQL